MNQEEPTSSLRKDPAADSPLSEDVEGLARTLFDAVDDGLVIHTAEGRILDANETWCRLHGVTRQQVCQVHVLDISGPAMSPERARKLWAKALAGEAQNFEWTGRNLSTGKIYTAQVFLRAIRIRDRELLLGTVTDITTRKQREERLRLQSAALESAANAIAIIGRDGAVQWVNTAFTQLTGYTREEITGRATKLLKSGCHPPEFYQGMWQTVLAGGVWKGELINRHKDGRLYSEEMTITPVRDGQGEIAHFIAIKDDITGRKRSQEALARQNQRLSILNTAAESLLSSADTRAALSSIYDQMARAFQVDGFIEFHLNEKGDALELVASKALEQARPPSISRLALGQGVAGKVAQTGKPMVIADAQRSTDPELIYVRELGANAYACHPLSVEGRILGTLSFSSCERTQFDPEDLELFRALASYVALGLERTRLTAHLEETVQERTAQLIEANANLQTFTHSAAHDLRSPLRTINSFCGILKEEFADKMDPGAAGLLDRILEASRRMTDLLNDLLEYSKINEAEIILTQVNLGDALQEALTLLQEDIRRSAAKIEVEGRLPVILGHRATVTLILTNFISNALKFMPRGKTPLIRIWAEERGDALRLFVEDNGIGIEPQYQEKVFQLFGRLHARTLYPGTGLGLALIRRAMERMGGSVGVKSEVGQGSCFWADFKCSAARGAEGLH